MKNPKQDADFHWFLDNYDDLFKKYGHKFLAIKDKKVIGVYDSYGIAYRETLMKEKLGTFIIQEDDGTPEAYSFGIAPIIW